MTSAVRMSAPARRGLTLLELLVVMVLIIAIAAITLPFMQSMLADTRVTAAGDQVRARLAETRALAMEEGKPFRFAFQAYTGYYQIAPEGDPAWDTVATATVDLDDLVRGSLPQDVIFCLKDTDLAGATGNPSGGGGTWEDGVVYLPDGSARDDAAVLFGKAGIPPLELRVRGLTGAVRLLDTSRPEDQQ
jgi:type II secretory pathway pseudopilin PulG